MKQWVGTNGFFEIWYHPWFISALDLFPFFRSSIHGGLPSGYGKWPIEIDDCPMKTSIYLRDFPWQTVSHNQMVKPIKTTMLLVFHPIKPH